MAQPVAGGDDYPPLRPSGGAYYPAKRRNADVVDDEHHYPRHKRPKYPQPAQFADPVAYRVIVDEPPPSYPPFHHPHPAHPAHPHHRYPSPLPRLASPEPPGTAAPAMERTASGHSIRSDPTERCASTELLEDREAAQRVRDHLATFRRRNPDSKHERILRSIINPRRYHPHRTPRSHHHHHQGARLPDDSSYPLDNEALESIFSAANEIFFNGRLSQRVSWDWSHASAARYDARVVGTTALRRAAAHTRGFETLIVLSSPILRHPLYSRRLLISTFLHELIHCYLFICCGFRARWCGGHTDGFREIAAVIDEWVGEGGGLYLKRVEADLELFREEEDGDGDGDAAGWEREEKEEWKKGKGDVYHCSGMTGIEQEDYCVGGGGAAAMVPSRGPQEVVYLGSGTPSSSSSAAGGQEVAYFGRGLSPISRPGTPTREVVQSYNDPPASSGGSSSNTTWWRQRRAVRPLYVFTGDEPAAPYVHPDTVRRRP
ncbi:hypothetical protein N658DRAFT_516475 [Parathielavia hyrcaniae]|uniref:SprT-like domain-containing protein n=1 Tax=Parathielavia hyrcaniae TaxID=113614 RepID=A0AAN6Q2Q8_9PEZI|nr:hypothetical protein N658DRAFT_516475 [Parathielavia hyrcaniae]